MFSFLRKLTELVVASLVLSLVCFLCIIWYIEVGYAYGFEVASDLSYIGITNIDKEYPSYSVTESVNFTPGTNTGASSGGASYVGSGNANVGNANVDDGSIVDNRVMAKEAVANYDKYNEQINEVFVLINTYRVEHGLSELTLDKTLCLAAGHRSAENASVHWFGTAVVDGRFRHIRPNGKLASSIASEYGLTGPYSENMGRYQRTPLDIFEGWKGSKAHNELMLSPTVKTIGVGVASDSDGGLYWTAAFQ